MILDCLFVLGICVEAITGAMAAGRKEMDIFGIGMIACIAGLGGGTVRDILFQTYPLTWVQHPEYILYTLGAAFLSLLFSSFLVKFEKLFLILDALGLSAFVILGTQKVLASGFSAPMGIISGLMTGICGGMLRDLFCNDIPLVFKKELYAVIAILGAFLFIFLNYCGIPKAFNIFLTLSTIFFARLWAIYFHIELPKWKTLG